MMMCKNCGMEIKDEAMVCDQCGAPVEGEDCTPEAKAAVSEKQVGMDEIKEKVDIVKTALRNMDKSTAIIALLVFCIGAVASGLITYSMAKDPLEARLASVQQEYYETSQQLEIAQNVMNEYVDTEAELAEVQVTNVTPKQTTITTEYGEHVTVGIDIAPGLYTIMDKDYDPANVDPDEEDWYRVDVDIRSAFGYGSYRDDSVYQQEGSEILLKAGDEIEADGVIFTPVKGQ